MEYLFVGGPRDGQRHQVEEGMREVEVFLPEVVSAFPPPNPSTETRRETVAYRILSITHDVTVYAQRDLDMFDVVHRLAMGYTGYRYDRPGQAEAGAGVREGVDTGQHGDPVGPVSDGQP